MFSFCSGRVELLVESFAGITLMVKKLKCRTKPALLPYTLCCKSKETGRKLNKSSVVIPQRAGEKKPVWCFKSSFWILPHGWGKEALFYGAKVSVFQRRLWQKKFGIFMARKSAMWLLDLANVKADSGRGFCLFRVGNGINEHLEYLLGSCPPRRSAPR